jgi:hypothetical protein
MGSLAEVKELENKLRLAELGPDPQFFADHIADGALLDGQRLKDKVIAAHQPGKDPKFTKVEMSGYEYSDHGDAVVVKCTGAFEGPQWSGTLHFMRVWLRRSGRWQIIAGTTHS